MQTVYFYYNGFPRNIKANSNVDIASCLSLMNTGYRTYSLEVSGCPITSSQSYIDIELDYNPYSPIEPTKFSYIKIVDEGTTTYFCFIDRIEPNNFNTSDNRKYYRIYYTVDWWTTFCYDGTINTTKLVEKLEGNVERAHVNDVKKVASNFFPDLSNTLLTPEFNISRFSKTLYPIGGDKYFLYVISSVTNDLSNPTPYTILGDRDIPYPLYLYIIPLFECNIIYQFQRGGSVIERVFNAHKSPSGSDDYEIPLPEDITDRSVFGIYCTNICNNYDESRNAIIYHGGEDYKFNSEYWYSDMVGVHYGTDDEPLGDALGIVKSFSTHEGSNRCVAYQVQGYVNHNLLKCSDFGVKHAGSRVNISTTFEEYKNNIVKCYFAPYTFTSIVSTSTIPIDTAYSVDVFAYYNIIPSIGCVGLSLQNSRLSGESKYVYIMDGAYTVLGVNDDITTMRQIASTFKLYGSYLNVSTSLASIFKGGSYAMGGGGILSGVGSIAEHTAYAKELEVRGETGYSLQSQALSRYMNKTAVSVVQPIASENEALKTDLALYGYNTFLHPHEILENHKRKYFNYIKLNNASINVTNLQTEIKLQLEEMFNNGVWLWNTIEEFGNFEVPNYPMIMEE